MPLDIARPLVGSMDQAIGEATTVMGTMVTELMRRSLRGGVLKIGEQLEGYVGECVDQTITERRPLIEQMASTVAEQTAHTTAGKIVGEEVYALEQRTTEANRTLAGQIEEAERRAHEAAEEKARNLSAEIEEKRRQLTTRIEEGDQQAIQVTHEKARELTGQIEATAKRVSEAAQAEIGQRVQELMDKAKEGDARVKARIQAVADCTNELAQRLDAERQAREKEQAAVRDRERSLTDELRELRRVNDELSARVAELEKPRGLHRLWLWLTSPFRRGKR
jgi:chromosome segregation ATPase